MTDWKDRHRDKIVDPERALQGIRSGDVIFIGSGAAEPQSLVEALARRTDVEDTEVVHLLTLGIAPYAEPKLDQRFRHNALFIGPNVRDAVAEGRADYTPVFLSEIPALLRSGRVIVDAALIQVSPPNRHGFCSFGAATDITKAAAESARLVIAEVNSNAPRALGDCFIHVDKLHALIPSDQPLPEAPSHPPNDVAREIGRNVADLIEDGATLQLGIGAIPDSVLAALGDRKDLGIHTEMFSDGVMELVKKGVITNARKTLHRDKIIASFVLGSRRLYDFMDDNPLIEFHPTEYTNDPFIIAQNDRMVAINSALEVDLTGQVCADSIGERFYSGIGGQVDFIRGAARSRDGKPIIALPSTAEDGTISRIVPRLRPGAGVVTSRGDVHYIVTEFGAACLHGLSIRERAIALIQIAHPSFRPMLLSEARKMNLIRRDTPDSPLLAATYPRRFETTAALMDGSLIHIRPIRLSDEEPLKELFYSLSDESVYHRFLRMVRTMPREFAQKLIKVDYAGQMALVVRARPDPAAPILALGEYERTPRTNLAEVAFMVRDEWQNRGIGTALLNALVRCAKANGIHGFSAEVLAENDRMLRIFHYCGLPVESSLENHVYHLTIRF